MLRLLIALLFATAASTQTYFSAALDGAQQVPPVATSGTGWSVVRFDPGTNTVRVFVYHLGTSGPPTAAHVHLGAVGANGGVVLPLSPASANTMTGVGTLSAANAAALTSGGTYVNVHTAANPGGELRGQIVPAVSTRFTGRLSGAQEVPANGSAGSGTVTAFLHEPEDRLVYVVEAAGLVNVTAAHLHVAPAGANGPVLVPLMGGAGLYCGVTDRLTAAQRSALLADGIYANVHTAAFPGGELRAQLIKELGDHFVAELEGTQSVPPTGSPGLGGANLVLQANGTLVIKGGFGGLVGAPTAAHVHMAPAGANGGVVFPLTISGNQFSAAYTPSAADLVQLRSGNWYVNVHSTVNPGGEVRGQLRAATLPTTFGRGCRASNGLVPEIGASGFLSVSAAMTVDLYGAPPLHIALWVFGLSRDLSGGAVPLPLELTVAGINAPGCFLLTDLGSMNATLTDGLGCAQQGIAVPLVPALRGIDYFSQWFVLDPAANPGGFVASSALSMTMQ